MPFKASAPGSLMLLGEYGVLYGKPALVCAVDKRITVTLTPRMDDRIEIFSEKHGQYSTTLAEIKIEKPFQFVLGVLKQYQAKLKRGCDIHIVSEFSDQIGFGSSAAVTVATIAALITWLDIRMTPIDLARQGRQVVRTVQGIGSGADIAASVYGGMVSYQIQPMTIEKIAVTHPITAVYSGFKTTTVEAIQQVQQSFSNYTTLFRHLISSIGQCAAEGIQHVRKENWRGLGDIMTIQQNLLASLGVSLPILDGIVQSLRQKPSILGAKISGSGLGDCVIGLGVAKTEDMECIPVEMTLQGVTCEKI